MSKLISKIISKRGVSTGTIYGIYKKGRVLKKYQGPKKAKFNVNSYDLNLNIIGKTKDGQRVIGKCILKYDLNIADYLRSLNECEESVTELGEKLSREISYDLSGVISQYDSKNLRNDDTKKSLESEIEKRSKITFLKKGINPYKITSKWEIFSEFSWVGERLENILSGVDEEIKNMDIDTISKRLEKEIKKLGRDMLSFTNYTNSLRLQIINETLKKITGLALLNPGKKLSEYISEEDTERIINKAQRNGLRLLVDYDV